MIDAGRSTLDLLEAIVAFQRQFIAESDPLPAFEHALDLCLDRSQSDFGMIGELRRTKHGEPVLKLCALVGDPANEFCRTFRERAAAMDIELSDLGQAVGAVVKTGKMVAQTAKSRNPKVGGAPQGFPPFTTFLGMPITAGNGELVGIVGLANRPNGYDEAVAARLQPICNALGPMLDADQRERQRRDAEAALRESEARLRIFADHVTDGIFLQDAEARVVDVNRRAAKAWATSAKN